MATDICSMFDIEIPLFAFSHCRDVVAAVTNAGGFGVLGASSHTPGELEHELAWIDQQVKGRSYGVDILCPAKYEGKGATLDELNARIPEKHKNFVENLLRRHDIDAPRAELFGIDRVADEETGRRLLDVSFRHPIKLIANALGVPPQFMIDRARAEGVPVAALVGSREHAVKQVKAGVDLLVAQGTEAGGHCGEVTTMVLVPEVVEAIKPIRDVPVLAAGGIMNGRQMAASIALGAAGAWTGSIWLATEESETAMHIKQKLIAATSRDTVRSPGRTGKPSRQLRSAWTEAWADSDSPGALPMPLQSGIARKTLARVDALADSGHPGAQTLATYWVGQGVGLIDKIRPARAVVSSFAEDYIAAGDDIAAVLDR
ncbi:NAD(P)H-dependent flavin oxidoreductase [Rhodococcus sp. ACT016]|uniref:NAD(P)H-dependent flavin oxidoreductase n=1 Tax=Rhodococcus sp. ACT016 TaxID=3134808 RepID=UPI003D2A252F